MSWCTTAARSGTRSSSPSNDRGHHGRNHLDSPIAAVLGGGNSKKDKDKRARAREARPADRRRPAVPLPRRYVDTGRLTQVGRPRGGPDADRGRGDRPTARSTPTPTVAPVGPPTGWRPSLRTDGPSLRMTFFAQERRDRCLAVAAAQPVAPRACSPARCRSSAAAWQLTSPQVVLFGGDPDDEDARVASAKEMAESIKALFPIYKVSGQLDTTDVQRVVAFGLTVVDEIPDLLTPELRAAHDLVDVHTRAALDPRPRRLRRRSAPHRSGSASRRRSSTSSFSYAAGPRCGRRAPSPGPAEVACWPPSTSGCRSC